jgi:hypothetical protein
MSIHFESVHLHLAIARRRDFPLPDPLSRCRVVNEVVKVQSAAFVSFARYPRRGAWQWSAPFVLAAVLALLLLVLTLRWGVPMMLWDHLDLVPLYAAMLDGTLASSDLWKIHGGHLHSAAYAVLLATTRISGGSTWLDVATSWLLLLGYAAVIMRIARNSLDPDSGVGRAVSLLVVFLALYPGHLSNLQWGWQVAVFMCLLAMVESIRRVTLDAPTVWGNISALVLAMIASASFAIGVAVIPTVLILLLFRRDLRLRARLELAFPWMLLLVAVSLVFIRRDAPRIPISTDLARYVLNFIGAGIARSAGDIAPVLAAGAIASGVWAIIRLRDDRRALPWAGFFMVVLGSAFLVAFARLPTFGPDQAFVTRYVSFSSLFWIGWAGLMTRACATLEASPRLMRVQRSVLAVVALLFVVNAVHLARKASRIAEHARIVAADIRRTWPDVPRPLLQEIYFDQAEVALQRIELLHRWRFAPFD